MVFGQKNKKSLVLFVLAVLAVFATGCSNGSEGYATVDTNGNVLENSGSVQQEAKTFVMSGENFKFMMDGTENPDLTVNEGDKVRIEFTSGQGFHDWVIDEFGARTSQVKDGESTFVEFTADKKGTFEYYCSVGSHRQMGMKGRFIVN
ncbi:cupredoxin domain-containing protein [Candidatus Woesearchaeota archaeon]|nr:cupredoxin domain-containing protein [Candidatus Woesearchaeota archaeon]